jgi:hypothetical protein
VLNTGDLAAARKLTVFAIFGHSDIATGFCNLARTIQTASYKQVCSGSRQGSTSKGRGFEPCLKPLTDHFGAD